LRERIFSEKVGIMMNNVMEHPAVEDGDRALNVLKTHIVVNWGMIPSCLNGMEFDLEYMKDSLGVMTC
jgi:hypothetical protein